MTKFQPSERYDTTDTYRPRRRRRRDRRAPKVSFGLALAVTFGALVGLPIIIFFARLAVAILFDV